MKLLTTITAVLLLASPAWAWSECGHHIVALMAYDLLPEVEQAELTRILRQHPRYAEDFNPPGNASNPDRWAVGRAGYWPDVARSQPKYNRPTWHYQLGATIVLGDTNVPATPGPLPPTANLDTKDLYVVQAMELCFNVLRNRQAPDANRALAICWLAHLVGDVHQPCHAGSLYVEGVFPDGDRGANSIDIKQGRNLHALWDGLLGGRYNEGDINRRLASIKGDKQLVGFGRKAVKQSMDGLAWVAESREAARQGVYTQEVMGPVNAAARGLSDEVGQVFLSEDYLRNAGQLARIRAAQAGYRLAEVWRLALAGE
jgi:hypothetical protein